MRPSKSSGAWPCIASAVYRLPRESSLGFETHAVAGSWSDATPIAPAPSSRPDRLAIALPMIRQPALSAAVERRRPATLVLLPMLAWLAWLLAGCAGSGLLTSIDDLTAHVDRKGLLTLEQQRILSLSGLIPSAPPGSIYRYQNKRSPFTAIGLSVHDEACLDSTCERPPAQHATKSFVVEREIPCSMSLTELVQLRDQLLDAKRFGARLIRLRLERLVSQQNLQLAEKAVVTTADRERLGPLGERMESLSQRIDVTQDEFEQALQVSQVGIASTGVMVVRAETKRSSSFSARLASLFTGAASKDEEQTGFAVLGGLRTMRLFVGQDLLHDIKNVSTDWYLIGRRFPYVLGVKWLDLGIPIPLPYPGQLGKKDFFLTTARLEAQYVLYAQDSLVEKSIRADVKLSRKALDQLGDVGEAERLELELVLNSVESLGSSAVLGDVTETISTLDTYRGRIHSALAGTTPEPSESGWTTVYAVLSEVDDLETLLRKRLRPHLTALF